MIATNYSEVRNNLKTYCDKATKDYCKTQNKMIKILK